MRLSNKVILNRKVRNFLGTDITQNYQLYKCHCLDILETIELIMSETLQRYILSMINV